MRRLFIGMLIFSCCIAFAQDKVTSVDEGSKAILFSFSGLDNLNANAFNGGIGGKYFLTKNLAIRLGVELESNTVTIPHNADSTETGKDGEDSDFTFGIVAAVEWHLTDNRVSPYIGGGVGYSSSSGEYYPAGTWPESYTGPIVRRTTELSGAGIFAVFGLAGVEVFLTQEISLAAEYHLAYISSSASDVKQTDKVIQGTDPTYPRSETMKGNSTSSFGFTTAGFLTLAIYL